MGRLGLLGIWHNETYSYGNCQMLPSEEFLCLCTSLDTSTVNFEPPLSCLSRSQVEGGLEKSAMLNLLMTNALAQSANSS